MCLLINAHPSWWKRVFHSKCARDYISSVYLHLPVSSRDSFDQGYPECNLKCQLVLAAQWETLPHAHETAQSCQMSREVTLIEYQQVRALSVGWQKNETHIKPKFKTFASQSRECDWAVLHMSSSHSSVCLRILRCSASLAVRSKASTVGRMCSISLVPVGWI